jgi:serine/threonine protein kinase
LEDRTVIQLGSPGSVRRGVHLNGMYEIETLIAQGGMGEVYKGFNIQTRDPVAIKMILPDLARNADMFALFRREASTLHNLQHEAIVRYFVFSVDPDLQRAYLAMEFVDGPSLTKRLTQGPLPVEEVTILRKRIAGALEAAHRVGVIHRDISSDNIILPGNDPRRAKIIDFGIARSQRPGEGTLLGGGFAGKYNYVAPEQLGLAGGDVTAKSDIYSFGLVLAEALRGRPIDMSGTQVEVIEKRRSLPDLSDIDPTMRPLLRAMLQPLPADRPESMATVAAWDESGKAPANRALASPPDRSQMNRGSALGARPSGGFPLGRAAAILGVLIVVGVVAGTLYLFRDEMPWKDAAIAPVGPTAASNENRNDNPVPGVGPLSAPGSTHKLPPLPDIPPPSQASAAPGAPDIDASKPSTAEVAAEEPSGRPAPHVPTADEIIQSSQTLASRQQSGGDAHSGAGVSPTPVKPPPPGPASGKSELPHSSSTVALLPPTAPTPAPVPPPTTAAAPATPPRAPQSVIAMDDAIVGRDYVADLPPFSDSDDLKALVLRAEPNPPEGLTFADLGSGFSQISGKPLKSGQYSFEIFARNSAGATARMTTRINVAPAPPQPAVASANPTALVPNPPPAPIPSTPNPVVASLTPADKAAAFLHDFDGGSCFFARSLGGASDSLAIQGIGSDKATFERFYGAFIRETGVEPALTVRLIGRSECPAVELIRAGGLDSADGPKISLAGYDVGRGKPLAGTVANLAGRHLDLLLVSNDGNVHRLDSRVQPGGGSATFNIPIAADAASAGALQVLLAIVSPKSVRALEEFKAGAAADILPRLRNDLPLAAGALDVEFFKMVE